MAKYGYKLLPTKIKIKAKKALGQNFLKDKSVLEKIINTANIKNDELILEIGPGQGDLTRELLAKNARVKCVELDKELIPWLNLEFKKYDNFELIEGDILKTILPCEIYKVVANIPYYITSPLINKFLKDIFIQNEILKNKDIEKQIIIPSAIVLMIQKEVAEKIIAKNGKESLLSLQVKIFGKAKIIMYVDRKSFAPIPNVDSAIIEIIPFAKPIINTNLKNLFHLLFQSFSQKRKTLVNNLKGYNKKNANEIKIILKKLKLTEMVRAEELTIQNWAELLKLLE